MQPDNTFGAYDCPDGGQIAPRRTTSTTPLQALNLLNSPFVLQQAELFAKRIRNEAGDDKSAQIDFAFRMTFGRKPTPTEIDTAVRLIEQHGLASMARALFNANEFLFVE
jgi:hypothetical protein